MKKWRWRLWLLAVAVSFGVLEYYGVTEVDGVSLSQFTVDAIYAWPPLGFLLGLGVGILVSHFFWPWVPKQLKRKCPLCDETILLEKGK